ncbi:YerC/YecD family TrpR-related protein [Acholeplasma hippikon]|uniref:Trp operon repressor n=1 Tax=Acholeplasma hippikon TaxID=264636 RepID=A0A449BIR0_9MOLU|nr:YerC/YecD family TrpR-related protein [Acholeplasma hippikon]VEU82322.1 Trp operon repressor [Acholeplasma hippikon]
MSYKSSFSTEDIDKLFEAFLKIKTKEEFYRVFEDLCTINEINDMALRLKVANMLKNKMSFQEISNATKASTATISRVSKALNYGAKGYDIITDK